MATPDPRPAPPSRHAALALLLIATTVAAAVGTRYEPNTFLHGDGAFYATTNRAITEGALDQRELQPRSWYEDDLGWNADLDQAWSNVSLGADGEWYPKHPLPLPLAATPLFLLLGYTGLLLFNALAMTIGLWLAWRLACRFADPVAALGAVVVVAALPLFVKQAYAYSNDVLYAALVVGGIEAFAARRFAWSGGALGLAVWAKPTNVVFALPLGLWLLVRRRWPEAARMAAAGAVPVLVMLVLNTVMFGGPLTTAYDRILTLSGGEPTLATVRDAFNEPLVEGAWRLLAGEKGLWDQAHVLWVGLLGCVPLALAGHARLVGLLLAWLGAYALFYGPYDYRYARFFLPLGVLLVTPLAALLDLAVSRLPRFAAPIPARQLGLGLVGALALACVVSIVLRSAGPWRAAGQVEVAVVERVPKGQAPIPCDYFNVNHEKWECARAEKASWEYWGRALGDRCLVDEVERDWLWLHVPKRATKRITWAQGVPGGDLVVHHGLSDRSRHGRVRFRVLDGDTVLADLETGRPGEAGRHVIDGSARTSGAITLEVPQQAHDWRQLCVDVAAAP